MAGFDRLDPQLRTLAVLASAASIGCSWCLDFGYYLAHIGADRAGLDLATVLYVVLNPDKLTRLERVTDLRR